MRTTLTIVCMMSALCAVGAVQKKPAPKSAPRKTSFTESELRTLAKATPDENNAGLLYSVAIATSNNVERKQEYLKVAAACLIACDKKDVYSKYVKGKLLDAAEFEGTLKDDCKQCSGTGTKKNRCYACKGSGQCSVCKGSGQTKTVKYGNGSFNKYYELKPCSKCKESGRCQRCDGEGTTNEKCWTCAGTGKAFSKTVAARVFHDSCNTIADSMNVAMASNSASVKTTVNSGERSAKPQCVTNGISHFEKNRPAGSNDADAQYELGKRYLNGEGVAEDKYKAMELFHKAAEQGSTRALVLLGTCYLYGKGVQLDEVEGARMLRKAAEQGDAQAQNAIGICYRDGKGVAKDVVEAAKWYRKAAEQEHAGAQFNLAQSYRMGEGVPQDKKEAVRWYHKAAEQGNADAQYSLGLCYGKGEGVPQNIIEAMKWIRMAAEQGDADARKAIELLEQACR